jgi:hypothetical protein
MKIIRLFLGLTVATGTVAACNNSDFSTRPTGKKESLAKTSGEVLDDDAKAAGIPAPSVPGARVADFRYGLKSTTNDILFIFDNSVSMNPHLANVKEGFKKLGSADWAGDVRMAVMTTMPGDPANLNKVHAGIRDAVAGETAKNNPYVGIELEPGFLSFVSAEAFQRYKQLNATFVSSYPEPLCSGDWFKPDDVNSKNERCLTVALQNPLYPVGCEAGMTALSQILDKKGKIFRDGAFAQIIFISDAQDPGCGNTDLLNIRPKPDALRAKVLAKNQLAGLKFHGAVPIPGGGSTKETTNQGTFDFQYNELIKGNNGVIIDITSGQDYSAFASGIAKSSVQEPVFKLAAKASKINFVKVDGKQLSPDKIQLSSDGLTVRLTGLDPNVSAQIIIDFMPAS